MKPEITFTFSTEGIAILPIINLFLASGWTKLRITIAWIFFAVDIEWPR